MENKQLDKAISAACDEMTELIQAFDDCTMMCPFMGTNECENCDGYELLKAKLEAWFRKKYGFEVEK